MAPRHTIGSTPPRGHASNRRVSPGGGAERPPQGKAGGPRGSGGAVAGALVGVVAGAVTIGALGYASGCGKDAPPPGPSLGEPASTRVAPPSAALPVSLPLPDDSAAPEVAEPDPPKQEPLDAGPWTGPWLGALAQATPVYPTARFSRNRLGYLRRGAKVPVDDKPIKTDSCKQGFYRLVDGGYVCGKYATTNVDDPRVRMGVRPPNLDAPLPYRYAYNTTHGTPLYISVPSKDEMLDYEPYLRDKKKQGKKGKNDQREVEPGSEDADKPRPGTSASARPGASPGTTVGAAEPPAGSSPSAAPGAHASAAPDSAAPVVAPPFPAPDKSASAGGGGAPPAKPWWQTDKGAAVDVKLSDLDVGDGTLAKRMVKGFYIAVDRTFGWNNRMWYRTTEGLVAPADRMIIPKTPTLEGLEWPAGAKGVAFARAGVAHQYELSEDGKKARRKGRMKKFSRVGLSGKTRLVQRKRYHETSDGYWLAELEVATTNPGPRPDKIGKDEKWVDVNLDKKTLVAFVGDKPVFAALVSPGKRSSHKQRDHRTKTGMFRIREKHVTTTMDGDGTVAGDLPYSIMDVPFVQYYDGSYALHGAFWHHAFGYEKSHGCVNLSPHDSRWLFGWTDPPLPKGWHGVWASDKRKGTWVVIHE